MKTTLSRKIFTVCNVLILTILLIISMYPFFNQLAISLSSAQNLMVENVSIIPKGFTLKTYKDIIQERAFWTGYKNTIVYTVVGTALSLTFTTMAAYALSKKKLVGKNVILYVFIFTMYFGAGLIPTFVIFRELGLVDTMMAVILPNLILPYHVLLMKSYFEGLPQDLEDAASIDGLSQGGYFFRIVLPLSKPILATMILFIGVIYWNDWFSALIYFNDSDKLPVTMYLKNALAGSNVASSTRVDATSVQNLPISIQAASMIIVILPVMCIYPFVQKHFTKGIMLGSIKG